jgi:hypothetical protein
VRFRLALSFALLALSALSGPAARANGYENIPTGSRTAALGAGIAGGFDSAMPTLNPAGLALIPGSVLSLSASLYQGSLFDVPHFVSDQNMINSTWGPLRVSSSDAQSLQFDTFPSGLAYFLHLGSDDEPIVLAVSLSVPRNVDQKFVGEYEYLGTGVAIKDNLTVLTQEQSYVAALSWAQGFGALRVGASLLASYTQVTFSTDRSSLTVLGTAQFGRDQEKSARNGYSFDAALLAGVQLDVTSGLKLGLAVRSPSLHVLGSENGSDDTTLIQSSRAQTVATNQTNGDLVRGLPFRVGLGVEIRGDGWGLAADGSLTVPRPGEYHSEGTAVSSNLSTATDVASHQRTFDDVIQTRTVPSVALGGELRISDSNWLRAGVFTDFASISTPKGDLNAGQALRLFAIDRVGMSAGLGTTFGTVDTTIGARASYGSGSTVRIAPDSRFAMGMPSYELTSAQALEALAFVSAALDLAESAQGLMKNMQKAVPVPGASQP